MSLSKITQVYSGTNSFALNFPLGYLDEDHITARVNDEVDGAGDPVYRTITFLTEGTVSVSGDLTNGDAVEFERTVPNDELIHDYADNAVLIEENLDTSLKQAIMLVHQVLDGRFASFEEDIDLGGNKMINVADGVADTDAANVRQLNETVSTVAASVTEANEAVAEINIKADEVSNNSTNSAASATASNNSALLAEKWATEDEDVEVTLGKYSARHWALKAQAGAGGSADSVSFNDANVSFSAANVQAAIEAVEAASGLIVSSNDTTKGTLEEKLLVGEGLSLTTQNDGGNETRTINISKATSSEAQEGTIDNKFMTPSKTRDAIVALGGLRTLQHKYDENADYNTYSNIVVPWDDTIPQITEGQEILSTTYTPKSANNLLIVQYSCFASSTAGAANAVLGLFKAGQNDALDITPDAISDNNNPQTMQGFAVFTAGTTDELTLSMRFGTLETNTVYINGNSSGRRYGGLAKTKIWIHEIEPVPTNDFPIDPRVAVFYDSIGDNFKQEAGVSGGYNDETLNYFSTAGGVQDMSRGGHVLLRSTAEAIGGGTATQYYIDDSAADPVDWTRGAPYTSVYNALTTPADSTDVLVVFGGTNDGNANSNITKAKYKQGLAKLKEFIQADFINCRFIILNPLHRQQGGSASDTQYQAIRDAQFEMIAEDTFFKEGITFYDADLSDAVHPTDPAMQGVMAERQAKNLAFHGGIISATGVFGPSPINATWDGTDVLLTINHDDGSDLVVDSGCEPLFTMKTGTNVINPTSVTRESTNSLRCSFDNSGILADPSIDFFVGYGALSGLAQSTPAVVKDNATPALPLRNKQITITNQNPIWDISNLVVNLDPKIAERTMSGSDVTSVSGAAGESFSSIAGRYPQYDSNGLLTAPDDSTHLLLDQSFTATVDGQGFGGCVIDVPASIPTDGITFLSFGTNSFGSQRCSLKLRAGGGLRWSRNDANGFEEVFTGDLRGGKAIILWNFTSLSSVDFYINSLTPYNFNPYSSMQAQNRLWLFAERDTYLSTPDVKFGQVFHRPASFDAVNDPSISDIMNHLNTKYSVGLTL